MIILRPSTPADIEAMAGKFRQADIDELLLSHRVSPEEALLDGLRLSQVAVTGFYEGRPIAIAGLYRQWVLSEAGCPWMIGTTELDRPAVARQFLDVSRGVLSAFRQLTPKMENWVWSSNRRAIRWLRWLGFEIHPPEPYGVSGAPFHRFTMGV